MSARSIRLRRAGALALVGATAVATLSGCGVPGFSGLYNIPLPGGANLGSHPFTVKADFTDVLDLVPQSAVRVNDVPVGRVSKIELSPDGKTAIVTMLVNGSVHLPANATADVQQTSLLGEKYIALGSPSDAAPEGTLADDAEIPVNRTDQGVQVEQVFGALSLLLNGGGLGQLQTINTELNKATSGHEADFKQLFTSLDTVVGELNTHRTEITGALDQLNTLSATLRSNDAKISNVLENFSPGISVLAQERTQLVGMLNALNRLSAVSVSTIDQSKDAFVTNLKLLSPILDQLAAAGQALPDSLQVLFTYPFPDAALGAIKGDYINAFITLDLQTEYAKSTDVTPVSGGGGTTSSSAGTTSSSSAPPLLLPSSSSAAASAVSTLSSLASAATSALSSATGSAGATGSASGSAAGSASASGSASSSSGSDSASPAATGSAGGAG